MNAKLYLEQIEITDTRINQKQIQLEELKLQATTTGGFSYNDKVKSSPSGDTLCNAVARYADLEREINDSIDHFAAVKNHIINEIQLLGDVKYMKILFMKYVQYKRLELIAVEMNYTYQYTKEMHGNALQCFQRTYQNLLRDVI